jgi:cyclopropane-fatty-acyl-phospholipid synthase
MGNQRIPTRTPQEHPGVTPTTSDVERDGVPFPTPPETIASEEVLGSPRSGRASSRLERWLLKKALASVGSPPLTIQLWDGHCVAGAPDGGAELLIRIDDRATLWKLLRRPEFGFADGYVAGTIQTDSDLVELTRSAFTACSTRHPHPVLERLQALFRLGARTRSASRDNVHHHYDLGNDFYRLWLDRRLLYTCAYFESEQQSLEAAQVAKMDHICRKLCLRSGERVIEAGCGWGAFALHMAREYGAQVTAYNLSREQLQYAREQAAQEGLSGRVSFIEDDWRQIRGECDVFVSVGMLEHVGPEHYAALGQVIRRCIGTRGRGLLHSIGVNRPRPLDSWTERRIFPGAQPPSLCQAMRIFEPCDLSVLDVENLRLHYALTLRHWLRRFEDSAGVVREMFDERFVRMWRMYLAASVSAFETGWLQLYQILFAPAAKNDMPLTRRHLYVYDPQSELAAR